jgi:hypothetical protein
MQNSVIFTSMSKTTQLLLFLTLLSICSSAQPYVSFPDSDATWRVSHEWDVMTYDYYSYSIGGDTTINGIQYKKLVSLINNHVYDSNDSVIGAIREDSLKRIFFYGRLTVQFENFDSVGEYLIYQFGLNIGDTIPLFKLNPSSGPVVVQDIDSVLVDGMYRKRYTLWNQNAEYEPLGWYGQTWIEGIGSDWGLLGPYAYSFEGGWNLYCFQQNGQYIYPDSNCLSVNIDDIGTSQEITLSPNPAQTHLTVQLKDTPLQLQSVSIYNITGHQINPATQNQQPQQAILSLENLSAGLYLCHIVLSNGSTITKKIIRQ